MQLSTKAQEREQVKAAAHLCDSVPPGTGSSYSALLDHPMWHAGTVLHSAQLTQENAEAMFDLFMGMPRA